VALWAWVPRSDALRGGLITQELSALGKRTVCTMMTVAAVGVVGIFAVYTFSGPFVTDAAFLSPAMIPVALALFGIGMTTGNLIGGRLADISASRGRVKSHHERLLSQQALGQQIFDLNR
jgi:DHA1 family inner membrane transport protein